MFTRLDELKKGDSFYIKVMGETLGYKVDRVSVIEPSDVSKLRIVEDEDRVTLMTCTPYGVNTHRLLVSGLRAAIPDEIPDESQVIDPRPVLGGDSGEVRRQDGRDHVPCRLVHRRHGRHLF